MSSWVEPATYLLAIGIFVGAGAIVWFLRHHSRWRDSVDTDRSDFKEFVVEIRADIKKIFERLRGLETRLDQAAEYSDAEQRANRRSAYENGYARGTSCDGPRTPRQAARSQLS